MEPWFKSNMLPESDKVVVIDFQPILLDCGQFGGEDKAWVTHNMKLPCILDKGKNWS